MTGVSSWPLNTEIRDVIYVGETGLLNGDFTKRLFKDGAESSDTVTVTETDVANFYYVAFTPTEGAGNFSYFVRPTSWTDFVHFTNAVPFHVTTDDFGLDVTKIRQFCSNRLEINDGVTPNTYTIYDDDGVTPLYTGDVSTLFRRPD